ncbi:MAG: porin [Exilibacterium sp.]
MKKALPPMVIAAVASLQAYAGTVTTNGPDIVIDTNSGLEVKTVDGDYAFKLGGRVQIDYNTYDGVINTVEGETGSDLFFRRARLELKGKAKDWSYNISYNLTDSGSIDKLFLTYNGWNEMARLSIGEQKEFFGLEDTGSSKWITAIERSMPSSAFDVGDNMGIKIHGANDLLTYSAGIYKESVDAADNSLDTAITGRLVFRPVYNESMLVHLGGGLTLRDGSFDGFGARLGVRGGENGTANAVAAGYVAGNVDDLSAYNLELAISMESLHLMAEYFDGKISGSGAPDIDADGYYIQLGWIMTGERRKYKTSIAAFDKVKPNSSGGAWEIFGRYDNLDVSNNNALITESGEQADSLTLGVNWYMNSLLKLSANYVHTETDENIGGEDDGDALVARLQYAF